MERLASLGHQVNRYKVYGLTVESDLEFPEMSGVDLVAEGQETDVRVFLRNRRKVETESSEYLHSTTLPDGTPWLNCARIEQGYLLRYVGFADFLVDIAGRQISCSQVETGVSDVTVRHLVLDQVFPMVLNLRGREAIHATAIVADKTVCAFSGPTGSGKSTLAASFFLAGFQVLGDDCLPLVDYDAAICVSPGYPGMRLWSDSIEALAIAATNSSAVAAYSTKRRVLGPETAKWLPSQPLPLRRVYRLIRPGKGEPELSAPVVEQMGWREAFIELVSSSFPLDVTDREMLARHFRILERTATMVPVRRLRIPNDLAALPAVRETILADLNN
jgi:hypothetical protein